MHTHTHIHVEKRSRNAVGWLVMWRFEKCRFKRWKYSSGLRPRPVALFFICATSFGALKESPERSAQLARPTLSRPVRLPFFVVFLWLIIVTGILENGDSVSLFFFHETGREQEKKREREREWSFSAVLCTRVQLMGIFRWMRCVKWLKSLSLSRRTRECSNRWIRQSFRYVNIKTNLQYWRLKWKCFHSQPRKSAIFCVFRETTISSEFIRIISFF